MHSSNDPASNLSVADAEAAVLRAILLDGTWATFDRLRGSLRPEHFRSTDHATIFAALEELRTDSRHDSVGMFARLKYHDQVDEAGGAVVLDEVLSREPIDVDESVRIVLEHARLQEVGALCESLAAEARRAQTSPRDFLVRAREAFNAVYDRGLGLPGRLARLRDLMGRAGRSNPAAQSDALAAISTGFGAFDVLTGGLHRGELTVLTGEPGTGKTSLLSALALGISRQSGPVQHGVVFFSLDAPQATLTDRWLAGEARVPFARVRSGKLSAEELLRVANACASLKALPIWVDDSAALSVDEMADRIRVLQAQFDRVADDDQSLRRISVSLVDYVQLLREARGEGSVTQACRALKALAKERNVSVVAVAQSRRAAAATRGKRSTPPDTVAWTALEEDADNVLVLENPDAATAAGSRKIAVVAVKQRHGPQGLTKGLMECECFRVALG